MISRLSLAKLCQYVLYCITFIGLLVSCYFLYMEEAIEKSSKKATTVTKRSGHHPYEAPSIIVCATPPFKASVSRKYNLSQPIRRYFSPWELLPFDYGKFGNITVQDLFEEFTYTNDLIFADAERNLIQGKNEMSLYGEEVIEIDLKKLPTVSLGTCHLIHFRNVMNWDKSEAWFHIGYADSLKKEDMPKVLTIYLTEQNDWASFSLRHWSEHQHPMKIEIPLDEENPKEVEVYPLTRDYFYPYSSMTMTKSNQESCINAENILKIRRDMNCKEFCIPYIYSSLFTTSEIKICGTFEDDWCAREEIWHHLVFQKASCLGSKV